LQLIHEKVFPPHIIVCLPGDFFGSHCLHPSMYGENEGSSCTKCGMHKNAPTDCCKDHVTVLKVQNDQSLPNVYHAKVIGQSAILPASINFSSPILIGNAYQSDAYYTPPPRSSKISYCILYCNFLI
jgi:hypothetical protein